MQANDDNAVDIKERLLILEKALSNPFSDLSIERILDVFISAVLDSQRLPKNQQDTHILGFAERSVICLLIHLVD